MKTKLKKSACKSTLIALSMIIFTTQFYSVLAFDGEIKPDVNIADVRSNESIDSISTIEKELERGNASINEQLDSFIEEDLKYFSPEEAKMVKDGINSNRIENNNMISPRAFMPDYTYDASFQNKFNRDEADTYYAIRKFRA